MGGVTNGELDPTVVAAAKIDSSRRAGEWLYAAAFHGKLGYDGQISERLSGSG